MKWFLFVLLVLILVAVPVIRAHAELGPVHLVKKPRVNASPRPHTRTVKVSESDVTPIRTAVGYSTILQFDGKPTAAVLGDQDAFKIEYVGQSLTIKPLMKSVKTNLFIFTDYDRYSFQLVTVGAEAVDYIVRVQKKVSRENTDGAAGVVSPADPKPQASGPGRAHTQAIASTPNTPVSDPENPPREIRIERGQSCGGVAIKVNSFAWDDSSQWGTIRFKLDSRRKLAAGKVLQFEPGDISILQEKTSIPIESLYLSSLVLSKLATSVDGVLVLERNKLIEGKGTEFRFSPDFLKPGCSYMQVRLTAREIFSSTRK